VTIKIFENDSYSIETTEEPSCKVSFKIMAKAPIAQKTKKEAIKRVNKQISIPGFRKGKAPDATVLARYSSHVDREWKEILVDTCYKAALEMTEIYPLNQESIQRPKILTCSEESASIALAFEHYPEVPKINFSELTLAPVEPSVVTEAKIQEVIDQIRRGNATFEEITGRAVQEEDFVDISIDAIDQDPPKQIVSEKRFEVSKQRMAPWLVHLLVGLEIGGQIEGTSELDEQADEAVRSRFRPTRVRITLHSIQKILLPELDESLAQRLKVSSVEELMTKVKANLENEAKEELKAKQYVALEEALLQHYSFDLPTSLVQAEKKERFAKKCAELDKQNLPEEEKIQKEELLEKETEGQARRSLTLYFLSRQIAKQGNLVLSNEELSDEVHYQLSLHQGKQDKAQTEKLIRRIASQMMEKKTLDYALDQVTR